MVDKQVGFLEFVKKSRGPFIPDEWNFGQRVRFLSDNEAILVDEKGDVQDRYDFSDAFPFDNGEEVPWFRRRVKVDRYEAGMYFRYRRWAKKKGFEDEGFEPFPLPTKHQLQKAYDDDWPFGDDEG